MARVAVLRMESGRGLAPDDRSVGSDGRDHEVSLLPDMVILRGGCVPSSKAAPRLLFRRIELPSHVHAQSSMIRLEDDLLRLSATKVHPA